MVDDHLERIGADAVALAVEGVHQRLARDPAVGAAHQLEQQLVLARRELDHVAILRDALLRRFHHQRADAPAVGALAGMAAQHGAQAGDQFIHGERLDEEIVRALVQALEALGQRVAGAGDDDGDVALGCPQRFEEEVAFAVGQAEVQHDGVEGVGGHPLLCVHQAAHPGRVVARLPQGPRKGRSEGQVIFDQQDGIHAGQPRLQKQSTGDARRQT
ncbi:hypothetical protein BC350_17990 (plasmid) [Ralstonia pseudosolanacearum]|nr:hypothetical protein BC350_17990 [Ralstonia pseudosolanacearum]